MALEEEFGFEIPDNEADKINSINLAVDFIASHPQAKQRETTRPPPPNFHVYCEDLAISRNLEHLNLLFLYFLSRNAIWFSSSFESSL